ncbi:MAG: hypothetical protein M0Q51_10925 [Bacteroidales bacterium]|nr:hypothetical protein [Bacteroidales bacterium]
MGKLKQTKLQIYLSGLFNPILIVFKSISRKHFSVLIFLIIPIIFLLNASVFHYYLGAFFLSSVDPEYFYLYNGILIGGGNLSVQFIATPGIPLEFLIAISSRVINLFQPGDYAKDFIDDPEKYIHAANLFMNVLIAIVLVICGIYTKKYSGSHFAGLLLQLSPFGNASLLGVSGRLMPEAIMMIPLLLTGLMIIKTIYHEDRTAGHFTDIVLYGLIIGFGIACKLTFIPVILIPLVLLHTSLRQKIKLILYTILFFAIFAYPVVFNFHKFWQWVSGLLIHSGKYGAGAKDFINFSTIPENFKYLFNYDKMFFFIAIFSLLLSVVFSSKVFKNEGFTNSKIIRAIFAVNLSILISIAFTLKHFEHYYFMPFYLFKYLIVLLSILLIIQYQKISGSKRYKIITLISFSIFILYVTYGQVLQVRSSITSYSQRNEILQEEYKKIVSLVETDKPVIMTCPYYGAPFIEFAHFNGFIMTYHLKFGFQSYLKEKFPESYQYVTWSDKFYFWDDFVDFKDILDKTKSSFYIYIGKDKGKDLAVIENRIWQVLDRDSVTRKVLYHNTKTEEQLIEIILNPETFE